MNPISGLQRNGLAAPTESMIAREFGWTGQAEMSAFQGLSGGNTVSACSR